MFVVVVVVVVVGVGVVWCGVGVGVVWCGVVWCGHTEDVSVERVWRIKGSNRSKVSGQRLVLSLNKYIRLLRLTLPRLLFRVSTFLPLSIILRRTTHLHTDRQADRQTDR